jgi:hypothetical protein
MAQQGSGTKPRADNPDPAMVDQTHYDARSGAAKKAQTAFPDKWGMTDQNAPSGVTSSVSPIHPGAGPDASAADVMDPETPAQRGKTLRRQPTVLEAKWDMKGGDGQGLSQDLGGKVLGEAILSGSTVIPSSVKSASGPAPAYTGKDPN